MYEKDIPGSIWELVCCRTEYLNILWFMITKKEKKLEYEWRAKFSYNLQIHASIIAQWFRLLYLYYGCLPSKVSSCCDFRTQDILCEDLRLRDKGEIGHKLCLAFKKATCEGKEIYLCHALSQSSGVESS